MSEHTLAAKEIRKFLKENKISASVRGKAYTGSTCVYVDLHDANPDQYKQVVEYVKRFQKGSFDAIQDLYVFDNVDKSLPQVNHVCIERQFSDEIRQKTLDKLHAEHPYEYKDVPTVYRELSHDTADIDGDYVTSAIRMVLTNHYLYDNFWKLVWGIH